MPVPDELRALLEHSGFEPHGKWAYAGEHGEQWQLAPVATARYVYFRTHAEVQGGLYSIYVEEWRGGEGYEDEEFRGSLSEAIAAIPRWVAWASEPFEPRPSRLGRFLRRLR
ncbi:MAG TPA: hypothetical protein VM869_12305 [Enhygromyxa sp.]|nr:hypothetical protein [Enhygromyxa sp.]